MPAACALGINSGKNIFIAVPKRLRAFRNCFFTGGVAAEILSGSHSFAVPFLRPKRVRRGFYGFSGRFDAFQGSFTQKCSTFSAVRAILPEQSHALSNMPFSYSYRAENRPGTASRAVFCFLWVRAVRRGVSAHLRGDSCPKSSKAGKTWYTKHDTELPIQ